MHERYEMIFTKIKDFQTCIYQKLQKLESQESKSESNHQVHKFFWKLLDFHAEYSLRLTKALSALTSSDYEMVRKYWSDFHNFICNNEIDYQASLDVYRVTEIGTKYTGFKLE